MRLLQPEEIVRRLVYDSISLSSHILRRNVGVFKIRRNLVQNITAAAKSPSGPSSPTYKPENRKTQKFSPHSSSSSSRLLREPSSKSLRKEDLLKNFKSRSKKSLPPQQQERQNPSTIKLSPHSSSSSSRLLREPSSKSLRKEDLLKNFKSRSKKSLPPQQQERQNPSTIKLSPHSSSSSSRLLGEPSSKSLRKEDLLKNFKSRSKKSLPPQQQENQNPSTILNNDPSISFLSQNTAERYRLYFELKHLKAHSKHRQIEQRLESLITEQLEANRMHLLRSEKSERLLSSGNTTLLHSTLFGALHGEGFVFSSGIRRFDFLLLDWRRKEELLMAVLKVEDNFFASRQEVSWVFADLIVIVMVGFSECSLGQSRTRVVLALVKMTWF